jgi:hypothetical protein
MQCKFHILVTLTDELNIINNTSVSTNGPKFLNWKHNFKLYYARQWIKRGRDLETLSERVNDARSLIQIRI